MGDIELVIKLEEEIYNRIMNGWMPLHKAVNLMENVQKGTPLPKGHGRLIDADAFISKMEDASTRQKYKELLIDDCLTVDDVFQAIIESLQNIGLAEGDASTLIEAESEGKE